MKTKEEYIEFVNSKFDGIAKDLVLKNIELYYQDNIVINKNTYNVGDDVFLKKGTFIHGLGGSTESYNNFKIFDYVV